MVIYLDQIKEVEDLSNLVQYEFIPIIILAS